MEYFEPACERMEWLDPFYKAVWEKAFADAIPISGTLELTPRCNFNCRMCYVHLKEEQIAQCGTELSAKEWIRLAQEARGAGTTWLCITGGEPMMHPEFEIIWKELAQMGFFVTLQTNASLIKRHEKLLEDYPPKKCKITLYGSNNEVYEKVCQVKEGFTRVDEGIQILKQMRIPIQTVSTVIQQNFHDVEKVIQYVSENRLAWTPTMSIKPSVRGNAVDLNSVRVPPRGAELSSTVAQTLEEKFPMDISRPPCTYCKDFRLGYWIVWNGYMRFCSFLNGPNINIREQNFQDCWKELVDFQEKLEWPKECQSCPVQKGCRRCAASFELKEGALHIKEGFCKQNKQREE